MVLTALFIMHYVEREKLPFLQWAPFSQLQRTNDALDIPEQRNVTLVELSRRNGTRHLFISCPHHPILVTPPTGWRIDVAGTFAHAPLKRFLRPTLSRPSHYLCNNNHVYRECLVRDGPEVAPGGAEARIPPGKCSPSQKRVFCEEF